MKEAFSLRGKVIIVTGATGVLGSAFIKGIAAAGAKVVILGRREAVAAERTLCLQQQGYETMYAIADVLKDEQLQQAKELVLKQWGRIDGLVNGAGGNVSEAVIMPESNLFGLNKDALKEVFDLNLYGTILPTLVFGEAMTENGGSIVNISSMAAQQTITRVLGYSMAKAAVDSFTRWMAVELAMRYEGRLRMNAVAPGFFIADQNRSLLINEDGSLTNRGEKVIQNTPFRRFGTPDELCGAIVWLLSDGSKFVNGEVVNVDGGFSVFSGV